MAEKKEKTEVSVEDLKKSIDGAWALARRLKDYMEKIFGADLDGDGHIGPAPAIKTAIVALLAMASTSFAWSPYLGTNKWAVADDTGTNLVASVDNSGNARFFGNINSASTNIDTVKDSLTVNTNVTVNSTLTAGKISTTNTITAGKGFASAYTTNITLYSVAAGTANAITNTFCVSNGVVRLVN